MLDAGAFLLQSHIQNLPQQLGGKVGGPNYLRTRDDATGAQNVIWGMPWISNEAFPGLAYCIGGRSLFWGGWSWKSGLLPPRIGAVGDTLGDCSLYRRDFCRSRTAAEGFAPARQNAPMDQHGKKPAFVVTADQRSLKLVACIQQPERRPAPGASV